jgi:hypothetical protein
MRAYDWKASHLDPIPCCAVLDIPAPEQLGLDKALEALRVSDPNRHQSIGAVEQAGHWERYKLCRTQCRVRSRSTDALVVPWRIQYYARVAAGGFICKHTHTHTHTHTPLHMSGNQRYITSYQVHTLQEWLHVGNVRLQAYRYKRISQPKHGSWLRCIPSRTSISLEQQTTYPTHRSRRQYRSCFEQCS